MYSDYTVDSIILLVKRIKNVKIEKIWETEDVRKEANTWVNVLVKRKLYRRCNEN